LPRQAPQFISTCNPYQRWICPFDNDSFIFPSIKVYLLDLFIFIYYYPKVRPHISSQRSTHTKAESTSWIIIYLFFYLFIYLFTTYPFIYLSGVGSSRRSLHISSQRSTHTKAESAPMIIIYLLIYYYLFIYHTWDGWDVHCTSHLNIQPILKLNLPLLFF
jgi:hypothetical protein